MPLLLPPEHPFHTLVQPRERDLRPSFGEPAAPSSALEHAEGPALRVGIINLMPAAERYEPMLLAPLHASPLAVCPVFIRLATHHYTSTEKTHLESWYTSFEQALRSGLDGLIVTGAPVEELAYGDVRYWPELTHILQTARRQVGSTLGICWGAMALAKLLDIEKTLFPRKLFGIYPVERFVSNRALFDDTTATLLYAQSRHAGLDEQQVEQAAVRGEVEVLASSGQSGSTILASTDGRYLAHLGHPEYTTARLRFEYARDRELGRTDVIAPHGIRPIVSHAGELETPAPREDAQALPHGARFLEGWLAELSPTREPSDS